MRFPPHLLDEIRARLPVSSVIGRKVNLKKKGREFAGLSPFKAEKTPSFFVNDQKGFYHCFASGEHGDIFTFLMKTEGLTFPEAVERLAEDAGVNLPKPTEQDRRREETRLRLHEVQETAVRIFERDLRSPAGQQARDYLAHRGISSETIETFRIGYATGGRTQLLERLKREGFDNAELAASGLIISGADIREPYDRFRNRIMFPITDLKERPIAFGGRALDPDQPAKYMNSPETPLFHKGHVLFNAARARASAFKREEVVVVEGYMDVVALHQAGIDWAVAPLGTALTSEQLQLLWRMTKEPCLCFDGDSAGQKAAHRAVETALPLLQPGQSLKFTFLPDGLDPDDVIRKRGVDAMRRCLTQTQSFLDTLWAREWGQGNWQTPEQRALLEKQLTGLVERIQDPSVRGHYQRAVRDRCFQAWRAQRRSVGASRNSSGHLSAHAHATHRWRPFVATNKLGAGNGPNSANFSDQNGTVSASLINSPLVANADSSDQQIELMIVAMMLSAPDLAADHAEDIAALEFTHARTGAVRDTLLMLVTDEKVLDTPELHNHLQTHGWEDVVEQATSIAGLGTSLEHVIADRNQQARASVGHEDRDGTVGAGDPGQVHRTAPERTDPGVSAQSLHRLIERHRARGLKRDLEQALGDFDASGSEQDALRVIELKQMLTSIEIAEASPADEFTP